MYHHSLRPGRQHKAAPHLQSLVAGEQAQRDLEKNTGTPPGLADLSDFTPTTALHRLDATAADTSASRPPRTAQARAQPPAQDEGQQYLQSLTAGIQAALRHGEVDRAQALFQQREQFASARGGQRRQQALNTALTQFQASGDPNTLLAYANQYLGGTQEYTRVVRAQDTKDGEPLYVVHGIDHTSGTPFANPLSRTQLMQMAHAIADPKVHQQLAVQQWQTLDELKRERGKAHIKTDESLREFDHKAPVEQRHRLEQIRAQGEEGRRLQGRAAAPADVQKAEWLVGNGVAGNADEAWDMVQRLKTQTREQFIQTTARELYKQSQNDLSGQALTFEEAARQAAQLYEAIAQTERQTGQDDGQNAPWIDDAQPLSDNATRMGQMLGLPGSAPPQAAPQAAQETQATKLQQILQQRRAQALRGYEPNDPNFAL